MNWLSIVKLFAGPIGNIVNTAITSASVAGIAWAASKGIDENISTAVISAVVLAAGTVINSLTGTQIVQIQNIRENQTNGVTVVGARQAREAGVRSVNAPVDPANVG